MSNKTYPYQISKSADYIMARSPVPQVSALIASSVSNQRRAQISEEIGYGKYREGSYSGSNNDNSILTSLGNVSSSSSIKKYGQVVSSNSTGGETFRGHGDTVKQIPEVYSPLWLNSNLNLPRDRATINAWCRAYYALNPFVHNAISLHSTYPISKLNIKCGHSEVEKFFNNMIEELDLMNTCVQIAQEYWLLGEAFPYAELNDNEGKWNRILIQNPDYMLVKKTVVSSEPIIMLRPDENLKAIIKSNKPSDLEQKRKLNPYIIDSIKRGQAIQLENLNVSHLARRISPYEIRGTGLPITVFRQLMLLDRLRESKYAQAESMINPLTLIKIGSADFKPTYADLEAFREQFEMAQSDKDFKLFTHDGVAIEKIATTPFDTNADITQLIKEIYIGLQVPSALMDGGADTTYANAGVALDLLRQRYMQFRNMMAAWLKRKIFAPISQIQDFYEYKDGEKQLIIPEIDWNYMSLFDSGDYITQISQLAQEGENKKISTKTLFRSLGLDYEGEQKTLRKELIQATILKKEKEVLEKMSLTAIRALDEDSEITETLETEEAVPGQETGSSEGGGLGGLGGGPSPGGLDLGGPSPSPSPAPSPTPEPTPPAGPTPPKV